MACHLIHGIEFDFMVTVVKEEENMIIAEIMVDPILSLILNKNCGHRKRCKWLTKPGFIEKKNNSEIP